MDVWVLTLPFPSARRRRCSPATVGHGRRRVQMRLTVAKPASLPIAIAGRF
jgi:hypothetical protein